MILATRIFHKGRIIPVIRGRKRKPNVMRDASGKSRGESVEEIKSVVLAYRRREVGDKHADNPVVVDVLGKLRAAHRSGLSQGDVHQDPISISPSQHASGEHFGRIVKRYAHMQGIPMDRPRTIGLWREVKDDGQYDDLNVPEQAKGAELTPEQIRETKEIYNLLYETLTELGRSLRRGNKIIQAVSNVCLHRLTMGDMSQELVGDLRVGLNAVGKVLRDRHDG